MVSALNSGERFALAGYNKFKFGMSEAELAKNIKLSAPQTEAGGIRVTAAVPMHVGKFLYEASFHMKNGELDSISLTNTTTEPQRGCTASFSRMQYDLSTIYGGADILKITGYKRITATTFTFQDRAHIDTVGYYLDGKCIRSVIYSRAESDFQLKFVNPPLIPEITAPSKPKLKIFVKAPLAFKKIFVVGAALGYRPPKAP